MSTDKGMQNVKGEWANRGLINDGTMGIVGQVNGKREPEIETEQMGKSAVQVTIRDGMRGGWGSAAGHDAPDHRLERLAYPGQRMMAVGALPTLRP